MRQCFFFLQFQTKNKSRKRAKRKVNRVQLVAKRWAPHININNGSPVFQPYSLSFRTNRYTKLSHFVKHSACSHSPAEAPSRPPISSPLLGSWNVVTFPWRCSMSTPYGPSVSVNNTVGLRCVTDRGGRSRRRPPACPGLDGTSLSWRWTWWTVDTQKPLLCISVLAISIL